MDERSNPSARVEQNKEVACKPVKKKKKIICYAFKFVVFLVFGALAAAGGFIVGDLVIGKFDTFDPSKFDASSYKESEKNTKLWKSKNIQELSATQIFVVAQSKILDCEYYSVSTKGYNGEQKGVVTTLGMKQDLYGYRYRDHNNGYFDYFSEGIATVIKKTEFKFSEDKFFSYEGAKNGTDVDWTLSKPESGEDFRTKEEYKALVGCEANDPIDYIVSTKTVVEEADNGKVGEFYSYTIKLNVETAVLNYVVKMNYMSGFGYPKFTSIELRFEVDDQMNFQNIYINESYKVIGMNANSKYKMEFSYQNIDIR